MTFQLKKSTASNRAMSRFNLLDETGTTVGSISVKPSEEQDLLLHWRQPAAKTARQLSADRANSTSAIAGALLRGKRCDHKAVLRGC